LVTMLPAPTMPTVNLLELLADVLLPEVRIDMRVIIRSNLFV
jgi:hypothetical protein